MSRIGRSPIPIPPVVTVRSEGPSLFVEGPKGKLSLTLPAPISVQMNGQQLEVHRAHEEQPVRALHGLYRALLANMVQGVATGFSKELEIVGVGFRAQLHGKQLTVQVGFSHPVVVQIPEGITVEVPKPTSVIVKGADKQPHIGRVVATRRWWIHSQSRRTFVIPAPRPPFRVEVTVRPTFSPSDYEGQSDRRELGAQVGYLFIPRGSR